MNADEFSLSEAATAIGQATGLPAYVEMMGGNVGGIEVGPTSGHRLPLVTFGPGTYTTGTANRREFHAAPERDRYGMDVASSHAITMPEDCADPVAWCAARAVELLVTVRSLPVVHETWDTL